MTGTPVRRSGPLLPPGVRSQASLDAVSAMRVLAQERNRTTARWLRSVHDAARVGPGGSRLDESDRFSADEIAPALGCSSSVAGRWVELADDLVLRLPSVLDAMTRGRIDEVKARALSEWTRDLQRDHARHVCAAVLEDAERLPTGMLIERVGELAIAVDPGWAARREARARRRARVVGSTNPEGTASLSGHDLPVEETVAALARVEALADRVRARGVDRPVQALRSAVYLRLLDGFGEGLDDAALVEALVDELSDTPDDPGPDDPDGPDDSGPDGPDGPDDSGPDDSGPDDSGSDQTHASDSGSDQTPADDSGSDQTHAADSGSDQTHAADSPRDHTAGDLRPADAGGDAEGSDPGVDPAAPPVEVDAPPTRGPRRGTTELRVRWSTVLGLDDLPARIPRWGPVLAATARRWIAEHRHAEWRIVLTTGSGRLRHVLLTRRRPPPAPPRPSGRSRARPPGRDVVELQIPVDALLALDPAAHPGWTALLVEAQARARDLPAGAGPDRRPDAADAAGRRRADAELDRWVRTRDRHCVFPGCPRPAVACDLDHTRAWAEHGPSSAANLGAQCRRHHRLKHLGGWTLVQPRPGRFRWHSRGGHVHDVPARRVTDPLPLPVLRPGWPRALGPDRFVPEPGDGLAPPAGAPRRERSRPDSLPPTVLVHVGAPFVPSDPTVTAVRDDEPPPF